MDSYKSLMADLLIAMADTVRGHDAADPAYVSLIEVFKTSALEALGSSTSPVEFNRWLQDQVFELQRLQWQWEEEHGQAHP